MTLDTKYTTMCEKAFKYLGEPNTPTHKQIVFSKAGRGFIYTQEQFQETLKPAFDGVDGSSILMLDCFHSFVKNFRGAYNGGITELWLRFVMYHHFVKEWSDEQGDWI